MKPATAAEELRARMKQRRQKRSQINDENTAVEVYKFNESELRKLVVYDVSFLVGDCRMVMFIDRFSIFRLTSPISYITYLP